jgi:phenylacetate-CoA ligase
MHIEDQFYSLRRHYEAAPQIVKTSLGHVYRRLPVQWRYGKSFSKFEREAVESETWDVQTCVEYQTKALGDSLRAAAQCPFYKGRFLESGVDPMRFECLSELSKFPLLTKEDLLLNHESMINPSIPSSNRLPMTTGGSTGKPVEFFLQRGISRAKEQAYLNAQWGRRGYKFGDAMAVIRGAVTSSRSSGRISYRDTFRNWLVLSSYHLSPERLPEYVEELNRFKPRHLHAYPSAALMLARAMQEAGTHLEFQLQSILCGSEKLSAEAQAFLEQHFRAPVLHWYGHSERVVLAGQGSRSNHLYFWPGYGYVEFGAPNELALCEIIGTSFHNEVMPLIRYRTGDYVQLPEVKDAELPMVEVEAVVGRGYEFLVSSKGRRVSLTAVNMHDDLFEGLMAVQFFQSEMGAVEFRYQPGLRWKAERRKNVRDGLCAKLGEDFELSLVEVKEVTKTAGGKHCWLVSLLKKEQQP